MFNVALNRRWKPRFSFTQLVVFVLVSNLLSSGHATEAEPVTTEEKPWKVYTGWPFSAEEARRRQEETAKAMGIPVEKTVDLGNGVTMEFILIPAGRFIMGTPAPVEPDELPIEGQVLLGVESGLLFLLVLAVLLEAVWKRRRPQFSLSFLLAMVLVASLAVRGGVKWWLADKAQQEYLMALEQFMYTSLLQFPDHEVTLSQPFFLGAHEVTQEQYLKVMATNPSLFKGPNLPTDSMLWDDAVRFCQRIGKRAALVGRLPTEAEWEYACRAGTDTLYHFGDHEGMIDDYAWHIEKPCPVGRKQPNRWGLYDMSGNVWEWCQDWFGRYSSTSQVDPQGPTNGPFRVIRGGSWLNHTGYFRSSARWDTKWGDTSRDVGFRVAMPIIPMP